MQIVTLDQVKGQLNITFSSRDTALTDLANRVEYEVLQYMGFASFVAFETAHGTEAIYSATVESAVLLAVHMRNQDPAADIWKGGVLARLLAPYRAPAIGVATD